MLSSWRNLGPGPYSRQNTRDDIQEYLIGGLPQGRVTAFEKALREDAHLAAQVQSLRRQNELLRELRSDILDEPVPEQLMAALSSSRCAVSKQGFLVLRARPARCGHIARLSAAASALLSLAIGSASAKRRTRR
jgi:anti-sigma factor RsiW